MLDNVPEADFGTARTSSTGSALHVRLDCLPIGRDSRVEPPTAQIINAGTLESDRPQSQRSRPAKLRMPRYTQEALFRLGH